MSKIKFKTTINGITGLNEVLEGMLSYPNPPKDVKIAQSIAQDIQDKLVKHFVAYRKSRNLFNEKKLFAVELKYHEAHVLEESLGIVFNTSVLDELMTATLGKIHATVNQQLA
jgi:hypothetical protein